jgi:hypothetical protein
MEFIKIALLALIMTAGFSSARAASKRDCVIQAEDPVISQFYRSKGFNVSEDGGDFKVEFEVTCEAIDQKTEKFSTTEIHKTTALLEVFTSSGDQRVVYHHGSEEKQGGRVETAFVVPCADTRKMKAKLLEASVETVKGINCNGEE